ncbi:MAG TPA: BamA/TamA family outer membrane protein [Candidatus Angelobacter sp.]|nr:BamA/TamA family outer membrane protein [Candidatus Angelobacter sp.]
MALAAGALAALGAGALAVLGAGALAVLGAATLTAGVALSVASAAAATLQPADSAFTREAAPAPAPVPVTRTAEWETLSTGLPEEARLRRIVRMRYNRVDGPAVLLGAAYQTGRGPAPVLFAEGGYAYSRKKGLYEAGFEAPFGDRPLLTVGGSVFRRTATEDEWIVSEGENTLFALFARTDYRDYYEAEGGEAYVAWSPGTDFELKGGGRVESERSLSTRTRVSLFGRHPVFRPNPAIQEGDDQALTLHVRVGPAKIPLRGGTYGEALYERSGRPFSGDFEYGRLRGAVRHRIRLSPARDFRARLIAGSTLTGVLPAQKLWYVGGIGTLRGHDFKSFAGDQFFLANAEIYQRARKNIYAYTFLDCGAAWFGRGNIDRQRPALDAGLGVRIGEGPAAVTVAKNLRDGGSKPLVGVRLGGSF